MDKIFIGTARNIEAEYSEGTYNPDHKFILVHQFDGETVSVEGFATKEGVIRCADTEYAGVERETLFIELNC